MHASDPIEISAHASCKREPSTYAIRSGQCAGLILLVWSSAMSTIWDREWRKRLRLLAATPQFPRPRQLSEMLRWPISCLRKLIGSIVVPPCASSSTMMRQHLPSDVLASLRVNDFEITAFPHQVGGARVEFCPVNVSWERYSVYSQIARATAVQATVGTAGTERTRSAAVAARSAGDVARNIKLPAPPFSDCTITCA